MGKESNGGMNFEGGDWLGWSGLADGAYTLI
jgi:hypothetical protein